MGCCMSTPSLDGRTTEDPAPQDIQRFLGSSQYISENLTYVALKDVNEGQKTSHIPWVQFVFPRVCIIDRCGHDRKNPEECYALQWWDDAIAFLCHRILGERLRAVVSAILKSDITHPDILFRAPQIRSACNRA
jgi:uncharacterized protein (DUF1810 family)